MLRHAKSDWDSGAGGDFDRPLSQRGREDAPRMGKWMAGAGVIPELVLCSPALRTRQTLAAVNNELAVGHIVYEHDIYGASTGMLLGLVERYSPRCGNLMITGHNPGLSDLLRFLCAAPPPLTAKGQLMTTATVAVLEFAAAEEMSVAAAGALLHLVRPADL